MKDICITGSTQLVQAMQCSQDPGSTGGIRTKMTKYGQNKNQNDISSLLTGTAPHFAIQLKENASLDQRAQTGSYISYFDKLQKLFAKKRES